MGILSWFKNRRLKPGQRCPQSGQYTWSQFPHDQVTSNKGDPMPPPPRGYAGGYWRLTDATRTHHD